MRLSKSSAYAKLLVGSIDLLKPSLGLDTEMRLLPASPPPSSMFRRGAFTLAHDRETRAVDNERQAGTCGGATQRKIEMLATPGPEQSTFNCQSIGEAYALLHESTRARTMPTDRILTGRCDTTLVSRGRSSDSGSRSEDSLTPLPSWTPGAKAITDDGLVAEERVLHPALTMVP